MVGQFEFAWCIELEWNKGGVNYAEEEMFGRKDVFSNGSAMVVEVQTREIVRPSLWKGFRDPRVCLRVCLLRGEGERGSLKSFSTNRKGGDN